MSWIAICLSTYIALLSIVRDEYMAVRNAEGSFYICKAMQNIFLGSKNVKIQWLSNEDPIVPAKDNPNGDIFAHDFYDKTGKLKVTTKYKYN